MTRGGRAKISVVPVRFYSSRKVAVGSVGRYVGRSEDHYRLLSCFSPVVTGHRGSVFLRLELLDIVAQAFSYFIQGTGLI